MVKKTTNKKVNVIKEVKDKEVSLDVEKTENVENTVFVIVISYLSGLYVKLANF